MTTERTLPPVTVTSCRSSDFGGDLEYSIDVTRGRTRSEREPNAADVPLDILTALLAWTATGLNQKGCKLDAVLPALREIFQP